MTVHLTNTVAPKNAAASSSDDADPFGLDITFIQNTPTADTVLMCSTSDNCGSSCPSACTTS